jgi:hypothetical protein
MAGLGFSPDFEILPDPESSDYGLQAAKWLEGTYVTNWGRLKYATCSSAMNALQAAGRTYNTFDRIREIEPHPGNAAMIWTLNYTASVLGPCLGAVALASFAVESFVRLGFGLAAELKAGRGRSHRKAGFDEPILDQLRQFDELPASQRLIELYRAIKAPRDNGIASRIANLVGFRNSIAHDVPGVFRDNAAIESPKRGRSRVRPTRFGLFEPLDVSWHPVRLKHVVEAIGCHDSALSHAASSARLAGWVDALREADIETGGRPISALIGGQPWWKNLGTVATLWEDGPERLMRPTDGQLLEARAQLKMELKRKASIRLVG